MARDDVASRQSHSTWLIVAVVTVLSCVAWMMLTGGGNQVTSIDNVLNDVTVAEELQDHANREWKREIIKVCISNFSRLTVSTCNYMYWYCADINDKGTNSA